VLSIDVATDMATVALGAVSRPISLALVEDVAVGDYVLIHVGYALNKISEEEAERTLALIAEMGLLEDEVEAPPLDATEEDRHETAARDGVQPHGGRA
jgi:hydrogenase expression/formation protein HypC